MSFDYPLAATNTGRFLLALRAGPVGAEELKSRIGEFAVNKAAAPAIRAGLVDRVKIDGAYVYRLTLTGRAKCPERRSLVGWVPPECRAVASQPELMEMAP